METEDIQVGDRIVLIKDVSNYHAGQAGTVMGVGAYIDVRFDEQPSDVQYVSCERSELAKTAARIETEDEITPVAWIAAAERWGENYMVKLALAKERLAANPQTPLACVRCGDPLSVFDVADGQTMCFDCREDEQAIGAMNNLITPSA